METLWNDIYNVFFLYENSEKQAEVYDVFKYLEINPEKVYTQYQIGDFKFDYAFLRGKHFVLIDILYQEKENVLTLKKKIDGFQFEQKIETAKNNLKNKNSVYLTKGYGYFRNTEKIKHIIDFPKQLEMEIETQKEVRERLLICQKTGFKIYEDMPQNILRKER